MKQLFVYILVLAMLFSISVLPVNASAAESGWDTDGMKCETLMLDPDWTPPSEPAATEPANTEPELEKISEETARYTAPQLNAGQMARTGEILSGTCGENATWKLVDGVLTISGTGKIADDASFDVWGMTRDGITEIVINSGITEIGNSAFSYFFSLKKVSLPDGLLSIGGDGFYNCEQLIEVTIPDSVTSIGESCFGSCDNLTSVSLPFGIREISRYLFFGSGIVEIVIPDGVTYIDEYAFASCKRLEKVQFPDSLTTLGWGCFNDCNSLEMIELPSSITKIPSYAFSGTGIVEITIPDTVTNIESDAFSNCKNLRKIIIPDSVTTIGGSAFSGCEALTSIELPPKITEIAGNLFLYSGLETCVIPDGVSQIGDNAFFGCENLKSIFIPSTVALLGSSCFDGCVNLSQIELPAGITEIPQLAFANSGITEMVIPDGVTRILSYAFSGCSNLSSVTIPDSVTEIWMNAFAQSTSLQTINLPDDLTEISWGMLSGSGLVELEIPDTVTTISDYAFDGCASLEKLLIPATVESVRVNAIPNNGKLTVYCWENSAAHYAAIESGVSYELMPEAADEKFYDIYLNYNDLGTAKLNAESSPANRYITIDVTPASENISGFVYVYYNSEEEIDLQLEQTSETQMKFRMPACEVLVEVMFIDTSNPFVDVTEYDYFYVPVLWANSMDITTGVDATHFAPNNPCTRGQVVTFLWRAAGSPAPASDINPFTDVSAGDYYYDAVLWAVENGITNGVGPGEFAPYANCTRAQIVTFLWRAMGSPEPLGYDHPFVDIDPTQYYYNPVLWAVEYGVTNGTSETTFSPGDVCTRGQIVTFLFRALA